MRRFIMVMGVFLAACDNPCQSLCEEMATYAEECELTVSIDDVQGCKDAFAGDKLGEGDKDLCKTWSDPTALREWWTCEDVAGNFQNGGGAEASGG